MPNSTSAAKRMRQSAQRRLRNRVTKKVIKTLTKRMMSSLASKDFEKAAADLKVVSAKIDKAGARRVLHPNTAARRKSTLTRAYATAVGKAKEA
jgi:small subunit ribosomal protein S20